VQCSAVQCSAVQCSVVQCSTVQCSAVQCSAVQCSAVQCSAVQAGALNRSRTPGWNLDPGADTASIRPGIPRTRTSHCIVMCFIASHCNAFHRIALQCVSSHRTAMRFIASHCSAFHRTTWHCGGHCGVPRRSTGQSLRWDRLSWRWHPLLRVYIPKCIQSVSRVYPECIQSVSECIRVYRPIARQCIPAVYWCPLAPDGKCDWPVLHRLL
jgi:hypothetical protein